MMRSWSHQPKDEEKKKKRELKGQGGVILHPVTSQVCLYDNPPQLTACPVGRFLAVLYMYMGVSCPVRSLNMAAGMVFMWIWRREKTPGVLWNGPSAETWRIRRFFSSCKYNIKFKWNRWTKMSPGNKDTVKKDIDNLKGSQLYKSNDLSRIFYCTVLTQFMVSHIEVPEH